MVGRVLVVAVAAVLVGAAGSVPACPDEDTAGRPVCVWDARQQGNGHGSSFVAVGPVTVRLP